MISVGDSVWIEEDHGDEIEEVYLTQIKVIEIKQRVLLGIERVFFKLENENWYAREEIYLNKKDLIKSLTEQNSEHQKDLVLDIQALVHELEDLKEKARLFRTRQDVLQKLKETI